jgi:hypothetical protein
MGKIRPLSQNLEPGAFALPVEYATGETGNDEALIDALRRYKAVNNVDFDLAKAELALYAP